MGEEGAASSLNRPGVRVRLGYCALFFVSMILAMFARGDINPEWVQSLQGLFDGHEWLGKVAVFRVALTLTVFHGILSGVFYGYEGGQGDDDIRSRLQNSMWCTKLTIYIGALIGSFFLPTSILSRYASFCIFGAGVFLFFQVMLLLTYTWNRYVKVVNMESGETIIIVSSCILYLAAAVGIVFLFKWFGTKQVDDADCFPNVAFICGTILLSILATLVSIGAPEEHGWGLFPAAVMVAYSVYMTFSALNSYSVENCNALELSAASNSTSAILGFSIGAFTIVYACFNISSQTKESSGETIGLDKSGEEDAPSAEEEEAGARTYSYSRFHMVFAVGSCYMAMLMTGWDIDGGVPESWAIDKGVNSMWAKFISLWVSMALFMWAQVAPVILSGRDFS